MNLKTLAAASVIAFLPATAMATITVNTEGVDGVQLNSLAGSGASTSDTTGGFSGLFLGPDQALDWNMRVINTAPPGSANTDGTATYEFQVLQDATISIQSTQNPFSGAGLDNLSLDLVVSSGPAANIAAYSFGAFAAVGAGSQTHATPLSANAGDMITVVSSWTGISGLFTEIEVDFLLSAESDNNPGDIPLPATALLLAGALGGLGFAARKRTRS